MASQVELRFRKSAGRSIQKGSTVLAAVSGGGDSIALLHLLSKMSRGRPFRIVVAHLDHCLRRGSGADRRFVEKIAAELGHELISDRRDVGALRRKSESPEEAARRVRRRFLLEALQEIDGDWILTGHTCDDQAETVLMRLLRGAGPTALAGIRESGPGPFLRPLLQISRQDLRDYLDHMGFTFREDISNRSLRFDRNRLRLKVIPFLEERVNPAAATHLVKAAALLRDDASCLDQIANGRYRRIRTSENESEIRLEAGKLASCDPAIGRRIVALALRGIGIEERRVTTRQIQAVLNLDAGGSGRRLHLAGGGEVRRTRTNLVFSKKRST